uniref:hypothetical protein n=1 Tax=Yinghuangia sp. YIM S09857 TaxID=3436929 RepID=UPI003F53B63A
MTKRRAVVWCWLIVAGGGAVGAVAGAAGVLGQAVVVVGFVVALVGSAAGVWSAMLTRRYGHLQAADRTRAAQVLRDEAFGDAAARYARQLTPDVTLIDTPFLVYEVGSVRAAATRGGAHVGGGSRLDLEGWGPAGAATRLMVLGPRGAGKSEAVVALAMAAVGPGPGGAARTAGPVAVVPVALDGFEEGPGLARWLAREIASSSALDEAVVTTLWKAGHLVPVLDGIDQMDPPATPPDRSRAAALLRQLNEQVLPTAALGAAPPAPGPLDGVRRPGQAMVRPPVVVTCLDSAWTELEPVEPLLDAVRVELQSVSATLAEEYVHKRTGQDPRWQPLLDDLHTRRDGPLSGALSTPWGLHLAVTAFHGPGVATTTGAPVVRDPNDLRRAATGEDVRDLLLANYLPAVLAARGGGRYSVAATQRYLARLARWLERNAGAPALGGRALPTTDVVVHELWPLAGRLRPRVWAAAWVGLVLAGACAWAASVTSGPWTASRWSVSAVSVAGAVWLTANTARWVWPGASGAGPGRVWGPPAVRGRWTTAAWAAAGLTAAAVGAAV